MSERMDDAAKSLASGMSRRGAFRTVIAGLFGLGAVALFPGRAQAQSSDVAVCIQEHCAGLRGLQRVICNLQCAFGNSGNDVKF